MTQLNHKIVSPYRGSIEKVYIKKDSYVYEWEKLFLIRTLEGNLKEVSIGASGIISSLHAHEKDQVTPNKLLACLVDDLVITGSD
jgi:biotin carboxyl carrier protein